MTRWYEERPFLPIRRAYIDVLRAGRRKNIIHGLVEADVTDAPDRLTSGAERYSFTAFVLFCVARAVDADRGVQAYRRGRKLVMFDEVDVNTQIEVELDGQKIVKSAIIRSAQSKSLSQLSAEIRREQRANPDDERRYRGSLAFARIPRFVRGLGWRVVAGRPALFKRLGGTVGLSSVGMFGLGGWGIPIAPPTLMVTVGGITRKPRFVDGVLLDRELLAITLSFDHDVVDGAPAARFSRRLVQLIEQPPG
jgi:pyruvate/2-oxoglutarate dehydrogenase complex dihydrolipoamide acyltransferase (E2) component